MDYIEQGQSIALLVNKAASREEAMKTYAQLEGLMMPKKTADNIFNNALDQKFPPPGGVALQKDPEFLGEPSPGPVAKLKSFLPVLEVLEKLATTFETY